MQSDLLVVGFDLVSHQVVHAEGLSDVSSWRSKGYGEDQSLICYYCLIGDGTMPGTEIPLVVKGKIDGRRRYHFSHPPGRAPDGGHYPETKWHVEGKLSIASWARQQPEVADVQVEWLTPDRTRRTDVIAELDQGIRVAFELQYQPLADGVWMARHRDYVRQGICDVWLWRRGLYRPGILLDSKTDVWWLDSDRGELGVPLGLPHRRLPGWQNSPDLALLGRHYPPCLADDIEQHWFPLDEARLTHAGIELPGDIRDLLRREEQSLRAEAARVRPDRPDPATRTTIGATRIHARDALVDAGSATRVTGASRESLSRNPNPPGTPWNERAWTCPRCHRRTRLKICTTCEREFLLRRGP
jgi:hypothetical protein